MKYNSTLLLLIGLTLLSACSSAEEVPQASVPKPAVQTQQIRPGLKQSITVPGTVRALEEANISADAKAQVIQLPVRIGDTVQKGQLLMVLGSDDVNVRLTNANISFYTAQQSLEQTKVGNTESIEAAQLNVTIAENNLQRLLTENATRRTQAQAQYDSAVLNNQLAVNSAEVQVQNALETTKSTISNALAAANVIFEYASTQERASYLREVHIGVKDPALKSTLDSQLRGLASRNMYEQTSLSNALDLVEYAEQTFTLALDVLENSVTSADYSDVDLNTDIATISNRLGSILGLKTQITSAQANLTATEQTGSNGSQVQVSAQAQLDATLAQLDSTESQSRLAVEQAKQNLALAKTQANSAELNAKTALNSVGNELRNVNSALNELRITAPFNGTVQRIDVVGGQEVQVGESLITLEGSQDTKIVAQLSATDRSYISIGTEARVNNEFLTTVTAISNSADPITQKYEVELLLPSGLIRIGEFVDIEFETTLDSTDSRLFVPITAVHIEANETYIWTVSEINGTYMAQKTPVVLGDIVDQYIVIESGLAAGQTIVTQGNRSLSGTGTAITITQ